MNKIESLTLGMSVYQLNDTLWGVRGEWEVVTAIRHCRDGLIEVELRDCGVLKHLLRAMPDTTVRTLH